MSTSVLSIVQTYQKKINHCQDAVKLLYYINKLYKLPVKVEHLQETGIGKTVNSLRKYNGEIGVAAKALVSKWKAMVAAEEDMGEKMETDHHEQNAASVANDINQIQHSQAVAAARKHESHKEHSSRQTNGHSIEKDVGSDSSKARESSRHHSDKSKSEKHHSSRERTEERHKEKHREHHKERKEEENGPTKERDSKAVKITEEPKEMPSTSHHRSEQKSSSSSSSSKRKREGSNEENRHHSSRDREKSKSSKDKDKDKEKSTKEDHKSSTSKKSSSSSHSTSAKSTNANGEPSSSSSSGHKDRHSSDKAAKETKPAKAERSTKVKKPEKAAEETPDDGIDSSMGANFEDVLGMLNVPTKKMKKSASSLNSTSPNKGDASARSSSTKSSSNIVIDNERPSTSGMSGKSSLKAKPELLRSSVKLEPLDPSIALELPSISTNYRPMPLNLTVMDCVFNTSNSSASKPARTLSDADALHHGISSKTMRTKIYSGVRTGAIMQVPSLFDLCTRFLQKNIDALEYTGGVPFYILRPVLERATPHQLFSFEEYNPYVLDDTDELWKIHVQRNYRTQQRQEMETWREMYLRCQDDQERKLNSLAETIKQSQKQIAAPVRKTQMAFVDSYVKPPRNVQRKQEQYGTKSKLVATPAARVAALSMVAPNAAKSGDVRLRAISTSTRDPAQVSHSAVRPKKGPLMAKALQLMRGRQRR